MCVQTRALLSALLLGSALPAVAWPPGTSALGFVAEQAGHQVQVKGNENSPVILSQLTVTCPQDGWLVVRAHTQYSITDNGDGFTAFELGISLKIAAFGAVFSDTTQARYAWEIGGQILSVVHNVAGGERIDRCKKDQESTYYFIGAQNNVGDETITENTTLVAEFFRSRLSEE
jgi:hypothetical protein